MKKDTCPPTLSSFLAEKTVDRDTSEETEQGTMLTPRAIAAVMADFGQSNLDQSIFGQSVLVLLFVVGVVVWCGLLWFVACVVVAVVVVVGVGVGVCGCCGCCGCSRRIMTCVYVHSTCSHAKQAAN